MGDYWTCDGCGQEQFHLVSMHIVGFKMLCTGCWRAGAEE